MNIVFLPARLFSGWCGSCINTCILRKKKKKNSLHFNSTHLGNLMQSVSSGHDTLMGPSLRRDIFHFHWHTGLPAAEFLPPLQFLRAFVKNIIQGKKYNSTF